MANITTLALPDTDYRAIISTLEHGYDEALKDDTGAVRGYIVHRPNHRVAFALKLEYATGMRISDIIKLRMKDIVRDGDRYRLDLREQKTGKKRTFRISEKLYGCIDQYCADHDIASDRPIIGGTTYGIQKQLKSVCGHLGLERVGTHSLRKSAASRIYEATGKDIVAVQRFLQHSSPTTTAKYIATCGTVLDDAIDQLAM